MLFGHPSMNVHMRAGDAKALASSKTPAHLKKHLRNKLAKGAQSVKQPPQVDPDAYDDLQEDAMAGQDDPQNIGDLQNLRPAVRSLATRSAKPVKKMKKKQPPMRRPGGINREMFFGKG